MARPATSGSRPCACLSTLLLAALAIFWPASTEAKSKFNNVVSVGDAAPAWEKLPGVDDKTHSLSDFKEARVVVVVFMCNHCPEAKNYEPRILELARKYADRKVQVVAISVSHHDADRLDKMKTRAAEQKYAFPYLYDESQKTGRLYGATNTPHFFVLDAERKIAYMGAFDDHRNAEKVERRFVIDAVEALLEGKAPKVKETLQRGCPIEYEE